MMQISSICESSSSKAPYLYGYDNPRPFLWTCLSRTRVHLECSFLTTGPRLLLAPLFRSCEATWPAFIFCHPRRAYHRTHCCTLKGAPICVFNAFVSYSPRYTEYGGRTGQYVLTLVLFTQSYPPPHNTTQKVGKWKNLNKCFKVNTWRSRGPSIPRIVDSSSK